MIDWDQRASEALRAIRGRTGLTPSVGIVLGSGLGQLAGAVQESIKLSTASIPYFPPSTVSGHAGELLIGKLAGRVVAVLAGRVHTYEGYTAAEVGFPIRLLRGLGCRDVILTNASGALNRAFCPGDVMLVEDHISVPGLAGQSPLVGGALTANLPRFVDLSDAYSPELRSLATRVAEGAGLILRRGVYVMVGGPHYETPAEVRFLRQAGGDTVGMSTVPEVIVARQLGMRVLALSVISNLAAGLPGASLSHEDVLASVARAVPTVQRIIEGTLAGLPE